jgi:cyclophilin family peptidyl-prolyl cis-trans isomerase
MRTIRNLATFCGAAVFCAAAIQAQTSGVPKSSAAGPAPLADPGDARWQQPAPDSYRVRVETSKGIFVLEVARKLAPNGADRFYHLVESGYYDNSRFFRAVPGRFVQFGIAGDPVVAQRWRKLEIPTDKEGASNARGWFGFSMTVPSDRSTQIFICTNDSMKRQDGTGFAIFGHVVEGMDVVDSLYTGYGETSGGGMRAGHQDKLFEEGNAYFDREFPLLDRLIRARIVKP